MAYKKTSPRVAASIPLAVRTGLVPNLRTVFVRIKCATMQCWFLVVGTRSQAGHIIEKTCTAFGNCFTPSCATRRTKSSLSLGRDRRKNVSMQRGFVFLNRSLFCASRLFGRHVCPHRGKATNSFCSRQNVLSKLFNERCSNRFIITDHSFWPCLMRFAIRLSLVSSASCSLYHVWICGRRSRNPRTNCLIS